MEKSKFSIRLEVFKQLQNEHQKGMEIRAGCRGYEYPFLCWDSMISSLWPFRSPLTVSFWLRLLVAICWCSPCRQTWIASQVCLWILKCCTYFLRRLFFKSIIFCIKIILGITALTKFSDASVENYIWLDALPSLLQTVFWNYNYILATSLASTEIFQQKRMIFFPRQFRKS